MAATAWVIWLGACVRYWLDGGLVFECDMNIPGHGGQILRKPSTLSFAVPWIIVLRLSSIYGAVDLFRSDMLLTSYMVWPWFFCETVFVCPQFPYRGNDMIFWIFPIVHCHAFCMWHWSKCKDLDLSFIWGHHHLHLVGMNDQTTSWLLNS